MTHQPATFATVSATGAGIGVGAIGIGITTIITATRNARVWLAVQA